MAASLDDDREFDSYYTTDDRRMLNKAGVVVV